MLWVRITTSLLEQDGDTRVVEMVEDISDQKQREAELREAKEEAERMNQLKNAFLANMSHEIRTPLTSIIGFAEAIGDATAEEEEGTVARFSRLIEESGTRLLDTLNGVLDLSKLEAGEMELELSPVDLAAEAKETVEQFGPEAKEAEVSLEAETEAGPTWAYADRQGLQIILQNLVSNAIKYTEPGGQIWVRVRTERDAAVLEVEDTGIGMDPETVLELFEAFKQASEGLGREYEGSGLGLAVTKEAVEQMDGAIDVETEKEVGSRFTVRLLWAGTENHD
jgi:signal transduction histidine kinase